nr:phosphoribosylaminoimidazolesuccinocarboxamide synthase [Nocardioides thalensis]
MPGTRHVHSGKVRDLYEITEGEHAGRLLMVASDRLSIFDFVLETTIPDKGEILTRTSLWWFDQLKDLVPNHIVSTDVPAEVAGRAVVCDNLDMFPVECVARGYLTGSGLVDYDATGAVCGIPLPGGLVDGSRLPEPIFTPATKADLGDHDENVDFAAVVATVGQETAEALRDLTLRVYGRAEEIARERGIILADTKFEFGVRPEVSRLVASAPRTSTTGGGIVLADEVLTPDSSRYWPAAEWQPGRAQPSYDKQIVRNWALSPDSGWDRASGEAPPPLPPEVVERTRSRYVEAYELLTGEKF